MLISRSSCHPLSVHLQTIWSGSSSSMICWSIPQICKYWPISWIPIVPVMSLAQWLSASPSATVLLRRRLTHILALVLSSYLGEVELAVETM
jgi:hypothetical protein